MITMLQKQLIEKTKTIQELNKQLNNQSNQNNNPQDIQNIVTILQNN